MDRFTDWFKVIFLGIPERVLGFGLGQLWPLFLIFPIVLFLLVWFALTSAIRSVQDGEVAKVMNMPTATAVQPGLPAQSTQTPVPTSDLKIVAQGRSEMITPIVITPTPRLSPPTLGAPSNQVTATPKSTTESWFSQSTPEPTATEDPESQYLDHFIRDFVFPSNPDLRTKITPVSYDTARGMSGKFLVVTESGDNYIITLWKWDRDLPQGTGVFYASATDKDSADALIGLLCSLQASGVPVAGDCHK